MFIRLYCLVCFRDDIPMPDLAGSNNKFISYSMRAICNGLQPQSRSVAEPELMERLQMFYHTEFFPLRTGRDPAIHGGTEHINQSINYMTNTIQTCLSNNLKVHFVSRLQRFINLTAAPYDAHFELRADRNRARQAIKRWLIADDEWRRSIDVDPCYDGWYVEHGRHVEASVRDCRGIAYDIKARPFSYLRPTVYMGSIMERMERDERGLRPRMFQAISLRTSQVPKYVYIDTKVLQELKLGVESMPSTWFKDLNKHKAQSWANCFCTERRVFRASQHDFGHLLQTDGVGVSLVFNHKHTGEKKCTECYQGERTDHANYIHNLSDAQLDQLRTKTIVGVDPGKYNLVYMADGSFAKQQPNGKMKYNKMRYTAWQRKHDTKQKHYEAIERKLREPIAHIERGLSEHCSKSVDVDAFKRFVYTKMQDIDTLEACYHNEVLRKNRFRRQALRQQADAGLLNSIERTFGRADDIVLAYGDWSPAQQMKHFVPTKGIGMRRLLSTRFRIVLVDEFRTSKLCSKEGCSGELVNRREHASGSGKIFRCLECPECSARSPNTQRSAFLTRDLNSALNIRQLAVHWIEKQNRPAAFLRGGGCPPDE